MDTKTCPGCGASNSVTTRWCSQCYTPLDQPPAEATASSAPEPPPEWTFAARPTPEQWDDPDAYRSQNESYRIGQDPTWRPPTPGQTSLPVRRKRSRWPMVVGIVAAVAAVAAFMVVRSNKGVSLPSELGGYTKIDSDESRSIARSARLVARDNGVGDVKVETYGPPGGRPVVALLTFGGVPKTISQEDFLSRFQAVASTVSGTSPAYQRDTRGFTVTCTDVNAQQPTATCAWANKGTVGLVIGLATVDRDEIVSITGEAAQDLA